MRETWKPLLTAANGTDNAKVVSNKIISRPEPKPQRGCLTLALHTQIRELLTLSE